MKDGLNGALEEESKRESVCVRKKGRERERDGCLAQKKHKKTKIRDCVVWLRVLMLSTCWSVAFVFFFFCFGPEHCGLCVKAMCSSATMQLSAWWWEKRGQRVGRKAGRRRKEGSERE